jgi:hypothetical protein
MDIHIAMNLVFIFKLFGGMQLPMDAHARYPSRWGYHIENAFWLRQFVMSLPRCSHDSWLASRNGTG